MVLGKFHVWLKASILNSEALNEQQGEPLGTHSLENQFFKQTCSGQTVQWIYIVAVKIIQFLLLLIFQTNNADKEFKINKPTDKAGLLSLKYNEVIKISALQR